MPRSDKAEAVCLHCERRPPDGALGLCAACWSRPRVRTLYAVRRRGWTPAWEARLRRLAERARRRLPLFGDGPPAAPGDGEAARRA